MRHLAWLLLCIVGFSFAGNITERSDVKQFIDTLVSRDHFDRQTLNTLFSNVNFNPAIIKLMQRPYEAKPWYQYQALFINISRIKQGVGFWHEHSALLSQIEKRFQVDTRILVATVGVESNYGQTKGNLSVLNTLSTLAFDYPARSAFFTKELEQYLLFTRERHLNPAALKGSYAGAMGFGQFMPSSYRLYGVTFEGESHADLVNHLPDALASTANYYHQSGWIPHGPVIVAATVNKDVDYQPYIGEHGAHFTLATLKKAGITPVAGSYADAEKASLIVLKTSANTEQVYIAFTNFYVIKRYNPSDHYAMVINTLGNMIQQKIS